MKIELIDLVEIRLPLVRPFRTSSRRYYAEDRTDPFELDNGCLAVPEGPGSGVTVCPEALRRHAVATRTLYKSKETM